MAVQLQCPACGAPNEFKTRSSLVMICESCHSVLARGDRKVEDLGKVAEIVETESPLQLGLQGTFQDKGFALVGRAQFKHSAGGIWDEWYAAFRDGQWGWLAEAQGKFFLTFQKKLPESAELPPWDELEVGGKLTLPNLGTFTVNETGTAEAIAAAGEMPFVLEPGTPHTYIDLLGQGGRMATLDAEESPPLLYVGKEVTLDELGISDKVKAPERKLRTAQALLLNCPQCGGPLELRAPDQSQRVTCPNCSSLLDIQGNKLEYFGILNQQKFEPAMPLGSVGTFSGVKFTVIGFVKRSVTYDRAYFWSEYLLYEPRVGFRWLIESDGHWSFGTPVSAGDVEASQDSCRYQGTRFKLFARAPGKVAYVLGEFYWKVELGETVFMRDYIAAPRMLSLESSASGEGDRQSRELNCTLATYLPPEELSQAFPDVKKWPICRGVAPNQPFLYKWIYKFWAAFIVALLALAIFQVMRSEGRTVFEKSISLPPAAAGSPNRIVFADENLDLHARRNLRVSVRTSLQNSWLAMDGDLFNEESGLTQAFQIPVEYYSGTEGGESWSEGSQVNSEYLPALPAGKYKLRLEVQSEKPQEHLSFTIKIEEGVFRWVNFVLAFLLISTIPACLAIYHWTFERSRWADSEFNPYASSSSDDE